MQIAKYCHLLLIGLLLLACGGCQKKDTPVKAPVEAVAAAADPDAAKKLFEKSLTDYHIPSSTASGARKTELLQQAEQGYREVITRYPSNTTWAAQAQRSLGNVQAEEGKLEESIKSYVLVEKAYPAQEWEIVQSWKSAADLLWEAEQKERAQEFYRKIVKAYDGKEAGALMAIIVKASKKRLE